MKGVKEAINIHSQRRNLWLPSLGIGSILAFLFLLLPYPSFSQFSSQQGQLVNVLTKALQSNQEVNYHMERLIADPNALQDSSELDSVLAKLKAKSLSETDLRQKSDSLRKAFAIYQNKLGELQKQEQKLLNHIQSLQQNVPAELLPPEARKLLGQIKPAQAILPIDIPPLTGFARPAALPRLQIPQLNKIALAVNISSQGKQVTEGPIDFFAGQEKEL